MPTVRAPPVSFLIPLTEFSYLGPDGEEVEKSEALQFVCHPSPLLKDQTAIRMREHELAGGLKAWQDLADTRDRLLERVRDQVRRIAWKDGEMPKSENPAHRKALDEAFREAWSRNDSDERRQWGELNEMAERISFLAAWPILLMAPEEWRNLESRDIPVSTLFAIRTAFGAAVEEGRKGKQKPSG